MENTVPIISIDRSQPFDPAKFLGEGWTIEEQDERSLTLTQVDFTEVRLEHMLSPDENYISGEEKLRRLKEAGYIRLDAAVFQILWDNKELIPESWKERVVYFDGTVLRDPGGGRYVLCLRWYGGQWSWYCCWLGLDWSAYKPSAVLASV